MGSLTGIFPKHDMNNSSFQETIPLSEGSEQNLQEEY